MDVLLQYSPLISSVMPLIIIVLTGLWVNHRLEKLKSRFQLDHAIIKKRADIYAEIQDDINTIYSYIKRVGKWKEFTPKSVLEAKRNVDQKFHTTQPYWSKETIYKYHSLMSACFETYRGNGIDAGIIAEIDKYMCLPNWQDDFASDFVDGYNMSVLENAYSEFMDSLSKDFGIA
ncbi:hypothetical protein ONE56_18170 [Vibrio mytili]|uniref:hypothetical protein n=1 Tax=Vibrio mytili TaxID=50718 RepID=UPI003C6EB1CE